MCHILSLGRVGQLAPARAGIPLAHRCRRALRGIVAKPTQSYHIVSSRRIDQWEPAVNRQPGYRRGPCGAPSCTALGTHGGSLAIPTENCYIVRSSRVGQLALPRAGIPLAHRRRRALRGTYRPENFTHQLCSYATARVKCRIPTAPLKRTWKMSVPPDFSIVKLALES
eukprot:9141208-Pyramimonas_sp.AAC.1